MSLLARELTLSARRAGLWLAVAMHAAVTVAFVHAWEGTRVIPVLPGADLSAQLAVIQQAIAVVAAPWIAARLSTPERIADRPRMALLFGVGGPALTRARLLATGVWVLLFCAAAAPAAILAHQMSAAPGSLLAAQGRVALIALAAALFGALIARRIDGDIRRWLAPAVLTAAAWLAMARGLA